MNYDKNEELRQDIAALSNEMYELQQKLILLEQKHLWNTDALAQRLAGQVIRIARTEYENIYKHICELDLTFTD
ncbi:hypothetical protein QEA29_003879 [Salmonella enterica]|nr:hypothetical protein [Salmonella enterica subsp. enterica]EKT1260956.1 hypothetical protein [Salmonella enterica]EKT1325620.1 hypothetical protein [Salmonella enterica]EKT1358755.1 hypothetical protein [Salmonella enterica]EKT2634789.1 hypothetical protein [Salmonella enterica]